LNLDAIMIYLEQAYASVRRFTFAWRRLGRGTSEKFASMRLREKLAAPYLALALIAAVCGVAGLAIVHRVTASVSVLSEVTSPLLIETMGVVNNAHQMRSAF